MNNRDDDIATLWARVEAADRAVASAVRNGDESAIHAALLILAKQGEAYADSYRTGEPANRRAIEQRIRQLEQRVADV